MLYPDNLAQGDREGERGRRSKSKTEGEGDRGRGRINKIHCQGYRLTDTDIDIALTQIIIAQLKI
jgi:hypothetical protein